MSNAYNMNEQYGKAKKSAKESLIRDGAHREWGARPLRRMIQNR